MSTPQAETQHSAICRFCHAQCSVKLTIEDGVVSNITGDKENPVYRGYSCIKGRHYQDFHYAPDRIVNPKKRQPDGSFADISLNSATDEIGTKLAEIIAEHGPRAVAMYSGTFSNFCVGSAMTRQAFMDAIGSPMRFTNATVDQPGKPIAMNLHGKWGAGPQPFDEADVCLIVGANPLVSMWGGIPPFNPASRLKDARKRGMNLIVIDPRRTETARKAKLHLQCLPGRDPEILAAMIKVIIDEELFDHDFVRQETEGFAQLAEAVKPFTANRVAELAGIEAEQISEAARLFANAKKGNATGGTGSNMAGRGTLMEYLLLALNTLCGRWIRAGETVPNLGVWFNMYNGKARAEKRRPAFGFGEKLRVRDLGDTAAGLSTPALPDEILTPGEGQVRALFVTGGNPLAAWPNHDKVRRALESLDLLVVIDPQLSATAELADYVIGPKIGFELPAVNFAGEGITVYGLSLGLPLPFAQYQPALIEAPEGELVEDWRFYYEVARKMNLPLQFFNYQFDMEQPPTTDELITTFVQRSHIPLETIKQFPDGNVFNERSAAATAKDEDWPCRLDIGNETMMAELNQAADALTATANNLNKSTADSTNSLDMLLISSRLHGVYNSVAHELPALKRKVPYNPVFINPEDAQQLNLGDGDDVQISNQTATVSGHVAVSKDIRRGVIASAHGFKNDEKNINTGTLIDDKENHDVYSGLPIMSGIAVTVSAA